MRALFVGLFAFCLVTQAAAAAMQGETSQAPRKAKVEQRALTLDERLEHKLAALAEVPRRRPVLREPPIVARLERPAGEGDVLARARESTRAAAHEDRCRASREGPGARRAQAGEAATAQAAICTVFGSYCQEARRRRVVRVAPRTKAQNGQYLGLFQMGSYERQPVRPRRECPRPVGRGAPVLRALRPRLEPVGCRWAAS